MSYYLREDSKILYKQIEKVVYGISTEKYDKYDLIVDNRFFKLKDWENSVKTGNVIPVSEKWVKLRNLEYDADI